MPNILPLNATVASPLPLDREGTAITNLVLNEDHTLSDARYRALITKRGAFFTESVELFDLGDNNRELKVGLDYKFIVPYHSLTLIYGKEIAAGIIIINPAVSSSVKVNYQALGDDYVLNVPAIQQMLNTSNDMEVSKSFLDLQNRDITIMPVPHYHDMGDGHGFEYVIFALETVARASTYADGKVLASMMERIEIRLNEIAARAKERQDGALTELMNRYRANFTKDRLNLSKTPNMPEATVEDSRAAADKNFAMGPNDENKLVTLRGLVAFRESIIQYFVSKTKTTIGEVYGAFMLPTISGMESMTNGARFIIDSLEVSQLTNVAFDTAVYPDLTASTARWTIVKISNNVNNRGGIFQAFNMLTGQMYMGALAYNLSGPVLKWRKHLTEDDMTEIMGTLTDHIVNTNNPHKLTKHDIHLGKVENLPIATRQTIVGRVPKREYVTFDGLLLFHAAFVTGDWTIDNEDDATPEQKEAARNAYTTLFSLSGACNPDSGLVLESAPRPTQSIVPPRGQPAGWYCEGTTKMAKITDGFGGYYLENTANSPECGFIVAVASYQIRSASGLVLGMGYPADGRVDEEATVALRDDTGSIVCFIFPSPATGRTSIVRDANDQILGYAVNVS